MVAAYDSTPAGLKALNAFLESRSFLEGFSVSQVDTFVFNKLTANIDAAQYPNVVRWYNHIASYGSDRLSFPGDAPAGETKEEAPAKAAKGGDSDSDDDSSDDDFEIPESSDDESDVDLDEIAKKRKADRAEHEAKKAAAAKSIIVFDIKPFTAETDMEELATRVKGIKMEGLKWSEKHNLIPVAYGIKKLQLSVVIMDALVSTDILEESVQELEDADGEPIVQSIDIQSFNKL